MCPDQLAHTSTNPKRPGEQSGKSPVTDLAGLEPVTLEENPQKTQVLLPVELTPQGLNRPLAVTPVLFFSDLQLIIEACIAENGKCKCLQYIE